MFLISFPKLSYNGDSDNCKLKPTIWQYEGYYVFISSLHILLICS